MDKIRIEDLEVYAKHGVFPEENVLGQKFLVSVTLYTDTKNAGMTDDLGTSIDYGKVCKQIDQFLKNNTYKLIEGAAEHLAEELLLSVPRLEKLRLEIKKPWAPIGLPLKTVAVEIERGWHTAYIALGSNMGDKKKYLDQAVEALDRMRECKVEKVSSYLETPPYGVTEQEEFLNACLRLRTLLSPRELLACLNQLEQEAGRRRVIHWGPRTLDLDIIFYDDMICQDEDLCIPHVEMHKRTFVLRPLSEIAAYKRHPGNGKTVREMLEELDSQSSSSKVS